MWRSTVLALCGCNQLFGLEPTAAIDAAVLPPDVVPPNACPAIGTPPPFTGAKQQLPPSCSFYGPDGALERAVGDCAIFIGEGTEQSPYLATDCSVLYYGAGTSTIFAVRR